MTAKQWNGWIRYYQRQPFGPVRSDLAVAQLSALTANIHRDPKKRSHPYKAADFMPYVHTRGSENVNDRLREFFGGLAHGQTG